MHGIAYGDSTKEKSFNIRKYIELYSSPVIRNFPHTKSGAEEVLMLLHVDVDKKSFTFMYDMVCTGFVMI